MQNQNINLNFFKDHSRVEFKLYLDKLVKVVVGYLTAKGYIVKFGMNENSEIEAIIFLEDVIISVRNSFFTKDCNCEALEYYLKVFLGQEVVTNREWDYKMMKRLGELYPRQYQHFSAKNFTNYQNFYAAYLEGIDPFTKQYINNWNVRIEKLFEWLDTITIDLSIQPLEWQKLYEASVRSINEQPLAPYYLISSYFLQVRTFIKVNKEQYLKILGFFVNFNWIFKKVNFYVEILNLEIIPSGVIEDTEDERFHLVFPAFSLVDWDPIKDFNLGFCTREIRKVYASKLFIKYYDYLKTQTSFFQDFPEFKVLASTETAMLTYLNTLVYKDDFNRLLVQDERNRLNYQGGSYFWSFLLDFMDYLEPFFIPYAKRKY
jgi:hypothetical protein